MEQDKQIVSTGKDYNKSIMQSLKAHQKKITKNECTRSYTRIDDMIDKPALCAREAWKN